MLVFLPGEREIRDVADELRGRMGARAAQQAEILPLYARLSPGEQQKVFKPHPGRRIVLATNVAETSLTVPGIRYVIDPGLARVSRFSPRHHVQRLPIEPIARDSADQRKGRCGRVGPGVCFRLYSEQDYLQRDEHTPPQIQRSDLADVILRMQALKLGAVEQFPFLDPPSGRAVAAGYDTLLELNALDDRRQLTPIGREMVKLPIDPRVARIVIAGHEQRCLREILILAAALSTPDPRLRPPERAADADRAHERFHDESSDFLALLKLWDFYHEQQDKLSRNQLRKACQQNFISHLRMREWKQTHRQLLQQAGEAKFKVNLDPADPDAIHRALLAGLLRFIARRRDDGLYEGADGRTLSLHPGSGLTRKPPRWIVSAEQIETSRLFASRCARISPQWLEPMAGHLIQRSHSEPDWFPEAGRAMTFERVSLFGLPIVPRRRVPLSRFDLDHARQLFIHHALVLREMETDAPWRRHYDAMLDEAQACIDRARRPDVLGDLKRRHDFFDALLPRDVDSRPAFEAWRKQAERDDPRVLFMPRQTIFAEPDARADAAEYPDRLRVAGQPLDAEYRYAPGESADGVTLTTPLPALRQLDETHALWGVPGWRQPIVAGLIRSLPRALRRGLPPAPDLAAEFLRLHANPTAEPLTNALGRWLSQRTGETIDARDFDPARLPDHLRPRFRVIDAAGAELAVDRDLPRLQHQLRDRIRGELHRTEHPWIRSGLTDWNFGELPATVTVDRPGGRVEAWPALVDAGDTLSIQLHDTPDAARKAMRGGLRRLVILSLPGPFKHLLKQAPRLDELAVAFAPLGPRPQLEQDLLSAAADRAIFAPAAPREPEIDPLTIRTPDQFAELLDRAWDRLHASMQQAAGLAHAILTARQQAALQLDELRHDARYAYLVRDVDVQMQAMLPRWFLTLTPLGWAPRLPVYLAAIQRRADKARGGRDRRDRELAGQVEPHWRRCLTALRAAHERGLVDPALQSYRWMIEELRVSLFAQELGAIATVSPQRLDTLWQQVRIKN